MENARFGNLERRFWHAFREKRALAFQFLQCECLAQFARFGAPDYSCTFVEVSLKTLILEFSFEGSLAENARFGSLDLQFLRMQNHLLALEVRIFSFRGSLEENARSGSLDFPFLRTSCRICSFWKSGSSVFTEVSQKTHLLD